MTQKASLNIEMPGVDFAGMAREAIAAKLTESMIGSDDAIMKIVAAALTTKVNERGDADYYWRRDQHRQEIERIDTILSALTRPLGGFVQEETPLRIQELPGSDRQATEAEADSAIKCLRRAIDAAENSNQAGENAVVKAASAIGWRRA